MGVVKLSIVEPQHGQSFQGAEASNVRLRGELRSSGHGTLYYRWYSSLAGALNGASDSPFDLMKPLAVGSHVLTFTTKDVQGDGLDDIQAVQDAGMAGGPPKPGVEAPCVAHVFVATMVEPPDLETASTTLNRDGGGSLTAVAPSQWGTKHTTTGTYERNPDYHEVNKIRYRWRFQPSGPPEDRAGGELVFKPSGLPEDRPGELVLNEEQMVFGPGATDNDPMVVRYQGRLPSGLGVGNYTLTLRVEDRDEPTKGHEVSRVVVLT
jgi:hypothetical protein